MQRTYFFLNSSQFVLIIPVIYTHWNFVHSQRPLAHFFRNKYDKSLTHRYIYIVLLYTFSHKKGYLSFSLSVKEFLKCLFETLPNLSLFILLMIPTFVHFFRKNYDKSLILRYNYILSVSWAALTIFLFCFP